MAKMVFSGYKIGGICGRLNGRKKLEREGNLWTHSRYGVGDAWSIREIVDNGRFDNGGLI